MNNASRILELLDKKLNSKIELTLYGRAALQLGYDNPRGEYAVTPISTGPLDASIPP